MPPRGTALVTVVVRTHDPAATLLPLVQSLDAQTAPSSVFEVLFADAGSTDGSLERLHRLATSRPNVGVTADDAAAAASGTWVLELAQDERLLPEAVARIAAAVGPDVDAVVGRRLRGDRGPDEPVTVRRREAGSGTGRTVELDAYALIRAPGGAEPTTDVRPTAAVSWHGRVLTIRVPAGDAAPRLVLVGADGAEHGLPTTVVDGAAVAEVDAADGSAPPDGAYRVRRRDAGGAVDLAFRGAAAALVEGRPVAVHAGGGTLVVDLGAVATGITPARLPLKGVATTESAAGTLLQVPLSRVHVSGPGRLAGSVHLGGLTLPAEVVVAVEEDGRPARAELRCYVSGLPGRSTVKLKFGGASPAPTGADLVVSAVGAFSLEPTPKPAPPPAAGNGARPTAAKPPARPVGALQRIRRRVPPALEPVVRRVARVEPVRTAYRRLTGR